MQAQQHETVEAHELVAVVKEVRQAKLSRKKVGRTRSRTNGAAQIPSSLLAKLSRMGAPSDAVARYLNRISLNSDATDIPGGVRADAVHYMEQVRAAARGEDPVIDYNALAQAAAKAHFLNQPLSIYYSACYTLASGASRKARTICNFLRAVAEDELPPSSMGVPKEVIGVLAGYYHAHLYDSVIDRVIDDALAARIEGATLREGFGEDLRKVMIPEFAEFVEALTVPGAIPPIPAGLDKQQRDRAFALGLKAACEGKDLKDLLQDALLRRNYGLPASETATQISQALARTQGLYAEIRNFSESLAELGTWPRLPEGLPVSILTILASARREARDLETVMVGTIRK